MSVRESEHVLVLVLDEDPDLAAVRDALAAGRETKVRLVAPAHVGALHWYTTDEDEEHAEADARAAEGERAIAPVADVEASGGEADPVLAVEDALDEFRADRILVVGDEDTALHESLQRFEIPVERFGGPPQAAPAGELRETGRAIMSGRSNATPYAVFGGVMLALGAVVALGFLIAALVLWI